jgi:hypothetical protein
MFYASSTYLMQYQNPLTGEEKVLDKIVLADPAHIWARNPTLNLLVQYAQRFQNVRSLYLLVDYIR